MWHFLQNKANRDILGWLGGGLAVLAAGVWAVITYTLPEKQAEPNGPGPSVSCGVGAGGNLTAGDITISNCPTDSKPEK